jgi:hypothetical protein
MTGADGRVLARDVVRCGALGFLMIKIVAAVALAIVVADASAFAQSYDPSIGSGNITRIGPEDAPSKRVGKLRCELDTDCSRQEFVGPTIPRPRNRRSLSAGSR